MENSPSTGAGGSRRRKGGGAGHACSAAAMDASAPWPPLAVVYSGNSCGIRYKGARPPGPYMVKSSNPPSWRFAALWALGAPVVSPR